MPLGATFQPQNQDPTRAPSTTPGATALPTDLLRPYQGYGDIRMWDYSGYGNYHALQTALKRRFDNGVHVLGLLRLEQGRSTINSTDFAAGLPNATEEQIKRLDYSYADYDRPHNFVLNFIYQTPKVADGVLGVLANDWQISGIYRYSSGRPYAVSFSIPGIGNANLSAPTTPTRASWSPATRATARAAIRTSSSTPRASRRRSRAATATSRRGSSCTGPPTNNLDMSLSKVFPVGKRVKIEVRLDAFNALNHTQFTGVNATANFASLTDPTITNLPYDANGNLVRNNGFGTHQRRGPAPDAPARDSADLLVEARAFTGVGASGRRPLFSLRGGRGGGMPPRTPVPLVPFLLLSPPLARLPLPHTAYHPDVS